MYIFIQIRYGFSQDTNYGVTARDLYISLGVSLLNLTINFYEVRKEAMLHGMLFGEYALSVLQLAEVPIAKFVPRLHAIKKGLVQQVNYCGFQFDKASITPLLEALDSENCKLQTIKLSIGSLSKLDLSSCKMLGYLLRNVGGTKAKRQSVNVLISRVSSLLNVKQLFERFDIGNKGYLTESEFLRLLNELKVPLRHQALSKQKQIFRQLAIRRHMKRDRIYFYDFFHKTSDLESESKQRLFAFDATQIDYPLHFIFQRIQESVDFIANSNGGNNKMNEVREKNMVRNLWRLFHFCSGLNVLKQIDRTLEQHVFYTILDALYSIDAVADDKKLAIAHHQKIIWLFFLSLIQNPIFDLQFFLRRNKIFECHTQDSNLKSAAKFILKIRDDFEETGYNIFEYCFFYADSDRNKCKEFVLLLEALLRSVNYDMEELISSDYLRELISFGGELNILYEASDGFCFFDAMNDSPLHYAVRGNHLEVVAFFAQYVMAEDMNTPWSTNSTKTAILHKYNCNITKTPNPHLDIDDDHRRNYCVQWIDDQEYLHSVLT